MGHSPGHSPLKSHRSLTRGYLRARRSRTTEPPSWRRHIEVVGGSLVRKPGPSRRNHIVVQRVLIDVARLQGQRSAGEAVDGPVGICME